MGMLNRIKRIVSANINHMMEKAENPEKMIKELIREMDQNIIDLRMEVARSIAAEKRLARSIEETRSRIETMQDNSERAVRDGDDVIAKKAIEKRMGLEEQLAEQEQQHAKAHEVSTVMKDELQRLEDKIQEARRKKEILIARKRSAQAQQSLLSTTQKFSGISRDAESLLERSREESPMSLKPIEDEVINMETEAEAMREVMSTEQSLEKKFDKARKDEEIEQQLQEIKKKINKASSK